MKLTQQEANKLKEVIQWLAEGREVEWRYKDCVENKRWIPLGNVPNDYFKLNCDYRIKPLEFPKEIYAFFRENGDFTYVYKRWEDIPASHISNVKRYTLLQD